MKEPPLPLWNTSSPCQPPQPAIPMDLAPGPGKRDLSQPRLFLMRKNSLILSPGPWGKWESPWAMGKSPSPHPGGRDWAIKTLGTSHLGWELQRGEGRPGRIWDGFGQVWGLWRDPHGREPTGGFGNWFGGNLLQGICPCAWEVRLKFLQFSLAGGFLSVPCSAWAIPAAQGRMLEPRFLLSPQHPPVIPINTEVFVTFQQKLCWVGLGLPRETHPDPLPLNHWRSVGSTGVNPCYLGDKSMDHSHPAAPNPLP